MLFAYAPFLLDIAAVFSVRARIHCFYLKPHDLESTYHICHRRKAIQQIYVFFKNTKPVAFAYCFNFSSFYYTHDSVGKTIGTRNKQDHTILLKNKMIITKIARLPTLVFIMSLVGMGDSIGTSRGVHHEVSF